jgi:ferric-dicitrate binding protein FerR (iron transport regulator)
MFLKNKTDWKLLAKYMAGEISEQENTALSRWIESSAENKALFMDIKSDWKKMEMMKERFNVDKAWDTVHQKIKTGQNGAVAPEEKQLNIKRSGFSMVYKVAASLLLLVMLGTAIVTITGRVPKVVVTADATEQGKVVELPDGSKVYLNRDTRLAYAKNFGRSERKVELTGEAFFEVTPDKTKPFRIAASDANIKVVGTSFNVNTRKAQEGVEVYVSTGIVELSENGNAGNRILLHPGNIGTINYQRKIESAKAVNANSIAWKTRDLSFTDTPLKDVIPILNEIYNVHIVLQGEEVDTIGINGEYHGDPLDRILKVITVDNYLTVVKSNNTIYLSRK